MIVVSLFVGLLATASAKPSLLPHPRVGPIHQSLENIATDQALNLRGGGLGSTSITKDDVAKFATLALTVRGTLLASDADKFVQPMGARIEQGSLAAWSGEHLGWATLALAKMAFICQVTSMGPTKACALGGIPCLFFFIKSTYSGTLAKLGFHPIIGPGMIVYLLGLLYGAFQGGFDEDILKALVVVPLSAFGAVGTLAPQTTIKMLGPGITTDADEHMWKSYCIVLAMCGAFAYTLLYQNGSSTDALGSAFLVWLIASLDIRFLRTASWTKMGASRNTADLYLAFVAAITGLLFAKETTIATEAPV